MVKKRRKSPNLDVSNLFDDFPVTIKTHDREFRGYFDGSDSHFSKHKSGFNQMASFLTVPTPELGLIVQGQKISVKHDSTWTDYTVEDFNYYGIGVTTIELGIWNKEA